MITNAYQDLFYLTKVHNISDKSSTEQSQKTKQIKYYAPDDPANKWQPLSEIAGKVKV